MVEFENLEMFPHESIINLKHQLDFLAHKVYPQIKDSPALNQFKYIKLIKIIPPNYQLLILQNSISDYNLATEKAPLAQDCDVQNAVLSNTEVVHNEKDRFDILSEQINSIQTSINTINDKHSTNFAHSKSFN